MKYRGQYPTDWNVSLLDNITSRASGHTPNKNHPEYWNGGIKWVSLADSSKLDSGLIAQTDKEISRDGLKHSSAVLLPKGTVIISRDAGVGKSAVLAEEMAVSQHFIAWKCDGPNQLHNWYLYNWLQLNKLEFERQAIGSTIKTIGLPFFKKIKIAHPTYEEQRRIAEILSTWDRAIEATEKLIANSEAQKKALMQQLLTGKKRLPGFEGEWNPKALNVLGKTYTGLTGKTKADFGAGKPFVPYKNVFANAELDMSELEYVRLSDGEKQSMVKYGDIIFTTSSETPEEVGMSSAVLTDIGELYMNSFCFGFRIKDQNEFSPSFAKHLFRSLELRRAISSLAQGSTRYNLSKNEFLKISIQLPSRVEQEKIVEVLDAFETAHGAEQKKLQKLKVEKSALMQQLLTGKRRVAISREEAVV